MMLEMQARSSDGYAMDWLWLSLYHALAMLWATFWALVLGFTISGVLQLFVSKERMSRAFGRTNLNRFRSRWGSARQAAPARMRRWRRLGVRLNRVRHLSRRWRLCSLRPIW